MVRGLSFLCVSLAFAGCTPAPSDVDGGVEPEDAGVDAGDAPPTVDFQKSLFWNDAGFLDDPQVVSFKKLMAVASADDHGALLLRQWFLRFSTTAHSERALPAQFIDQVALSQGADLAQWDLGLLPFKVTGLHNRIDLMQAGPGGHCGEFRASVTSTDPTLQPFHALFIFQQPAGEGDVGPGLGEGGGHGGAEAAGGAGDDGGFPVESEGVDDRVHGMRE